MDKKVKMIDWFDDHFYQVTIDENTVRFFPSVTTKLGIIGAPFLARWRGEVGNEEADRRMNEAMDKGSRIHHAVNVIANGGVVIYNPWNRPNYTKEQIEELKEKYIIVFTIERQIEMLEINRVIKWFEIVKPQILESETIVYSLKREEAGTMDLLIKVPQSGEYMIGGATPVTLIKGIYVVDLKSGKSVDDNALLQTSAYAHFYKEMKKKKINGTIIIHTNASTRKGIEGLNTIVRTAKEMKDDFKDFCHVAKIWDRKQKESTKPKIFQFPSMLFLKDVVVENKDSNEEIVQQTGGDSIA